jgi:energy-coupling factor transporter ATP-binding protein EcfA2
MRVNSIKLKNYRKFEEFECEFDANFNLLMGENGCGKTSLLKGLHVGLSIFREKLAVGHGQFEVIEPRRINSVDPSEESWRIPVYPSQINLMIEENPGKESFGVSKELTSDGEHWGIGDSLNALNERSHSFAKILNHVHAVGKNWFDSENISPIPVLVQFGANKPPVAVALDSPVQRPFENKKEVWSLGAKDTTNTQTLTRWFQYHELRTLQEKREPPIYRQVRAVVLTAIHALDIKYVVVDNALMVRHEGHGWRPFDELSDGQLRLASIFCDLAMRCATLNSHLGEGCIAQTPGIVTIDELDLHLHPQWQRSVVADLRKVFPQIQFIVTSHSPFLLQTALEHGRVIDMVTGQAVEPSDPSIEDITESLMHVEQPQRSKRFLDMRALAQQFYELLEQPTHSAEEEAQLKVKLDAALAVFANDPASAAWLQQRRLAAGR